MRHHAPVAVDDDGVARLAKVKSAHHVSHRRLQVIAHRDHTNDRFVGGFAGGTQRKDFFVEDRRDIRLGDVRFSVQGISHRNAADGFANGIAGAGHDQFSLAIENRKLKHPPIKRLKCREKILRVLRILFRPIHQLGVGYAIELLDGRAHLFIESSAAISPMLPMVLTWLSMTICRASL